jgi:hypothetical protein
MEKTLQECKEIIAKGNGWYDWNQVIIFNTEIQQLTDLANKMYYEQSEWVSLKTENGRLKKALAEIQHLSFHTLFDNCKLS